MRLRIATVVVPAIREVVRQVNPNFAIFQVKTMTRVVDDSLWELRLYTWLIGAFAALALTLATVGLYGVLTYAATVRAREFAIRIALGSDRASLVRLVLGFGLRLTVAGLIVGAVLSAAAAAVAPTLGVTTRSEPAAIVMGTAVLLHSHEIIVVGGLGPAGNDAPLANAAIYNPANNTWRSAAPLPSGRWRHTMTLLDDGTVLVAGGSTDNTISWLNESLRYDPRADTWTPTATPMASGW